MPVRQLWRARPAVATSLGLLALLSGRRGLFQHFRPLQSVRSVVSSLKGLVARPQPEAELPAGDLWLIVGLGNPGPKYEATRHNVGFMCIDQLAQQQQIPLDRVQHKALVGRGALWGQKVLLAKPQTYMNDSGVSIARLASFYKVPMERILVVMDDLDLPTAKLRLRAKGSHGGHNGMRSIIAHLGGNGFPRLKIGIGSPTGSKTVIDWVLQKFSSSEQEDMSFALQDAIATIQAVLVIGFEKALSGQRVR